MMQPYAVVPCFRLWVVWDHIQFLESSSTSSALLITCLPKRIVKHIYLGTLTFNKMCYCFTFAANARSKATHINTRFLQQIPADVTACITQGSQSQKKARQRFRHETNKQLGRYSGSSASYMARKRWNRHFQRRGALSPSLAWLR